MSKRRPMNRRPRDWFLNLAEAVAGEDREPAILDGDTGQLLIVPEGGRVLACKLDGVDENLFFHTDLTPDETFTGGDRLWIAPEAAYFWPTLAEARRDPKETARTPRQIDPGHYHLTQEYDDEAVLDAGIALFDVRNARAGVVEALRTIKLQPTPEGLLDDKRLAHFAFTITNSLSFHPELEPDEGLTAAAWDILQVPVGGTLVCPTTSRATARSYYEPFGERHVDVSDTRVRFLVDGKRRVKMGLTPEKTTGRMAYLRPLPDGRLTAIVRVFAPQPGEPYADLPLDDRRHDDAQRAPLAPAKLTGDALQAYNDDGDAFPGTTFGEMEYQDPAITAGLAPNARTHSCVTHVLAGPPDAVRNLVEPLLGCPADLL